MSIGKTNSIGGSYQKKTITPYNFVKNVLPDANYNALSEVEIDGVLIDPHIPIESVQDNLVKYQKVIPNNVLTYGGLSKLGGKTYKWNQLLPSQYQYSTNVTIVNGYLTINSKGGNTWNPFGNVNFRKNHKYAYIIKNYESNVPTNTYMLFSSFNVITLTSNIITYTDDDSAGAIAIIFPASATTEHYYKGYVMLADLTSIYGAGNEPSTVDDFLNDYPIFRGYVPYNTGTLDYAYTKKVDIKGFNIFDEETESGYINDENGALIPPSGGYENSLRSKNFIPCVPNQSIYGKQPTEKASQRLYWFDINKNYISSDYVKNTTVVIPVNAYYFKWALYNYGTTYNNDICINVSNNTLNGTYKPSYHNALLEAKIVAIKQKLVSLGYSAAVLGYGLDNVYNYIDLENKQVVLNMFGVDMGVDLSFAYQSLGEGFKCSLTNPKQANDIKTIISNNFIQSPNYASYSSNSVDICYFKTGNNDDLYIKSPLWNASTDIASELSGVPLIYELATPVEIDVSDILDNDDIIGELESGGTITFENDEKYNLPSNLTYLVEVE